MYTNSIVMSEKEFEKILDRYQSGKCTTEEKQLVEDFYEKNLQKKSVLESWSDEEKDMSKRSIKDQLWKNINQTPNEKPTVNKRPYWIGIAASVALLAIIGFASNLLYLQPEDNVVRLITKATDSGQKMTVNLPDGSVVRLNSKSQLTYEENFSGGRSVSLSGEAFFTVEKDAGKPFTVKSGEVITTVLGTSFNIDAYPDIENIKVTVATGLVRVESEVENQLQNESQTLVPGQQAIFSKPQLSLKLKEVSLDDYLVWKDGIIRFKNASLKEVVKQLSEWYGVEFDFSNKAKHAWDYSAEFQDMSLETVLRTIGFSEGFEFQIEDKKVTIQFTN